MNPHAAEYYYGRIGGHRQFRPQGCSDEHYSLAKLRYTDGYVVTRPEVFRKHEHVAPGLMESGGRLDVRLLSVRLGLHKRHGYAAILGLELDRCKHHELESKLLVVHKRFRQKRDSVSVLVVRRVSCGLRIPGCKWHDLLPRQCFR